MIGNSADVMPVLTTKADIFSFGLVMLLIVLAEEGPRSMSKVSNHPLTIINNNCLLFVFRWAYCYCLLILLK